MLIKLPPISYSVIAFYFPVGSVYEPKELKRYFSFLRTLNYIKSRKKTGIF